MAIYRVGHPYQPGIRQWPETNLLRITPSGVQLVLFWPRIGADEVEAVRHGAAEFAWVDSEHAAVLASRFGGEEQTWSDCPYHPALDPQAGLPEGAGGRLHLVVHVLLVDADTGLVVVMRQTTWPPGFARRVAQTVDRMLATPYSEALHDDALTTIYERYPNTPDMVRDRADAVCVGGAQE